MINGKLFSKWAVLFLFMLSVQGANAAIGRSETSVLQPGHPTLLGMKAGMIVGGGDALPGVEAQVVGRLNTDIPLYAGAEFGVYFYHSTGNSAAVMPIMGTVFTVFSASSTVHPTIGMSAGPALTTGAGFDTARFMLLFDPGVNLALGGMDLVAQMRFGVLGSTFIAAPQLGLSIPI